MLKSRSFPFSKLLAAAVMLLALGSAGAFGQVTGVPSKIIFVPSAVKQSDAATSTVTAMVTLAAPSPTFFICQLRSANPRAVRFSPIIFSKGQKEGKTTGAISWDNLRGATSVKVTAFSVDNPLREISGIVALQVAKPSD
jgi:hypothetical protein